MAKRPLQVQRRGAEAEREGREGIAAALFALPDKLEMYGSVHQVRIDLGEEHHVRKEEARGERRGGATWAASGAHGVPVMTINFLWREGH